jgi:glycosyltransferase involved in cell wall biosynthesis
MRLVMDLQACQIPAVRGGDIGRYSMAWAKAVLQRAGGHEVHVVLNGAFAPSVDAIRQDLSGWLPDDRIRVFGASHHVSGREPSHTWQRRVAEVLRSSMLHEMKPDLVHLSALFEGLDNDAVTSIGESALAPPAAMTLHDLRWCIDFDGHKASAAVDTWRAEKMASLRRAELVLVTSGNVMRAAVEELQLPASRVVDMSMAAAPLFRRMELGGAEKERLLAQLGLSRTFILSAGDVDRYSSLENLIRAYATLPTASRRASQLVVSNNIAEKDRAELRQYAAKFGLGREDVVVIDSVSDEQLAILYSMCQLFVYPVWHDMLVMPVLEALACGAPVIAANTPLLSTVIGRHDALFDPRGYEGLGSTMQRVLTDEGFRLDLMRHGQQQSRLFCWDEMARRALDAMEASVASRPATIALPGVAKPRRRLALVSALSSDDNSKDSDSVELLSQLTESYEVDLISDLDRTVRGPVGIHLSAWRDFEWFRAHASTYDRVIYHFYDSPPHAKVLALLKEVPGTVVLEEFHLGHLLRQLESSGEHPGIWSQSLYTSHGYPALVERKRSKNDDLVADTYPCSWQVLADAEGVITHYHHCKDLVEHWYGSALARRVRVFPLQWRLSSGRQRREQARARLGLPQEAFIFTCLDVDESTITTHRLVAAWKLSGLVEGGNTMLVVAEHAVSVGHSQPAALASPHASNAEAGNYIVCRAARTLAQYGDLLDATDVMVRLEDGLSGAIRDGLAYGIPAIVRTCETSTDIAADALWLLGEDGDDRSIADALVALRHEPLRRQRFESAAHHHIEKRLTFPGAIESFVHASPWRRLAALAREITAATAAMPAHETQWVSAARGMAEVCPLGGAQKQLLVDVSTLAGIDARSGVQRVVRSVLTQLLNASSPGQLRVEPVYADPAGVYRYARHFVADFLDLARVPGVDAEVEASAGDTFLGLDLCAHIIPERISYFRALRERGVSIQFVVYDLLPALHPDWFPPVLTGHLQRWYRAIAEVSDRVIAISKSVAAEYRDWLDATEPSRTGTLQIGYFHLGADIEASAPVTGIDRATQRSIDAIAGQPVVLMVGTVEPRKGHEVALDAFEELWSKGSDAVLVVVGKRGWRVDSLASRLATHVEYGRRLHWFQGMSDEALELVYRRSALLLAASFGEGFGLPLIEAAHRGLPLLARDIPVFREVAGDGAIYFQDDSPCALASILAAALTAWRRGELPPPQQVRALTWAQSTIEMREALDGRHDLYSWQPGRRHSSWQAHPS